MILRLMSGKICHQGKNVIPSFKTLLKDLNCPNIFARLDYKLQQLAILLLKHVLTAQVLPVLEVLTTKFKGLGLLSARGA